MSEGLALALFASLAWGITDVSAALASRRVGSVGALAGTQVASLGALALLILIVPSRLGPDPAAGILAGLPLGVAAAAAYLGYFVALRIGPISIVSPIIVAYGGTTVVLAVVLQGETLEPLQVAGAALATIGVMLAAVVFEAGSVRSARVVGPGAVIAVVTMLLFSIVTVALAGPIRTHGFLPVVTGSRLANVATALVLLAVTLGPGRRRLAALAEAPDARGRGGISDRGALALVAIAGVCDIAAFSAYAIGLEVAPIWLVGLGSSFGPVIVIGYAVGRLGERPRPSQWLGLALLAGGIVALALAG